MCNLLDSLVIYFALCYHMRDVKDMGQQMGYRSLEWKEAMNIPIWAGIVDGAKLF